MFFEAGSGTGVLVTEMPDRSPAEYATVSFMVTGIEQIVAELKARGVAFERPASSSFQGSRASRCEDHRLRPG